jgi:colanic acid/amylovoran biosynthesis glycosyltransferase
MPVRPLREQTWPPGSERAISNTKRLVQAIPALAQCALSAPLLTRSLLDQHEYSYRACSLSGIFRLRTLLNARGKFDVLHAHFGTVGNYFRFARALFRAPFVVSFHGYDFSTVPRKEGRDVYKHLFAKADAVTANSNYTKGQLEALGCPREKIINLPVGLNPKDFIFHAREIHAGEPVRILTVARLVEIKGHEYVLRALGKLRSRVPDFHYHIVGDGPLRKHLENLTAELRLMDTVTFHGARSEEEVRRLFANTHVFVLCSVNVNGDEEGQGLVLQEAQACGLPVVATRHGAFQEGIAPENSYWLVPERDVDELATKLQELIEANAQWPSIGNAGRIFVAKRYDIRVLNQQLVEVYENAIQDFQK